MTVSGVKHKTVSSLDTGFLIPTTFRWIPQINTSKFRYDASPFVRITNSCEITKNAAARWMTFVKNSSSGSPRTTSPERKPFAAETSSNDGSPSRVVRKESPKWEPMRKFSAAKDTEDPEQKQDNLERAPAETSKKLSPESHEQSQRLNQRMRDLYDFKTENEWPKRATNARRQNAWISKSSSEEDRGSQPVRRNSQDLEFNDRLSVIKLRDTKVHSDHQEPKQAPKRENQPKVAEEFNSEYEERLRKFNERLRYSDDLGQPKPKIKERRTYSDDYDEKPRRGSTRSTRSDSQESRNQVEMKRNSNASTESRGSYAEVSPVKRDSQTSNASYASIGHPGKRASVDCKSTRPMVELPPRRAFSQTEDRPASPVPPKEFNDDRYAAARLKVISERQKRDSTRYKVYLT